MRVRIYIAQQTNIPAPPKRAEPEPVSDKAITAQRLGRRMPFALEPSPHTAPAGGSDEATSA